MDVSVVIPVFNEEKVLAKTFRGLSSLDLPDASEVIFVNDGSKDASIECLEEFAIADPRVKVIDYPLNRGKGYAVRTGIQHCSGQFIGFIDADMEIPITYISQFIGELRRTQADVVVAVKDLTQVSTKRAMLSRAFRVIARNLIGTTVTDTQTGLKFFKAATCKALFDQLVTDGFAFDLELIARAEMAGLKVIEIPVTLHLRSRDQGQSKLGAKHLLHSVLELWKIRRLVLHMRKNARQRNDIFAKAFNNLP